MYNPGPTDCDHYTLWRPSDYRPSTEAKANTAQLLTHPSQTDGGEIVKLINY